ncbi:MAG: helix-turn-helix domain-containing protein [Desulfomonilia bacterium]|nr:helix-turn-helix domain-containing protein [Desulfomonilia bacterium]
MSEHKLTLGEYFRKEREDRGIDLKDIEERTKIPAQTLRFLEDDQIDMLPPKAFVRGFLQVISREFDLNEEELLNLFEEALVASEKTEKPYRNFGYPKRTNAVYIIATAVVILILVVIFGVTMKQCRAPQQQTSVEPYAIASMHSAPCFPDQVSDFL